MRNKLLGIGSSVLGLVAVAACGDSTIAVDARVHDAVSPDAKPDAPPEFTPAEIAQYQMLGPLPAVPADPTNAYADNPAAATLGQMFFFEKSYSGPLVVGADGNNGGLGAVGATGKVACASCHGGAAGEDNRSNPNHTSLGIDRATRNALGLVNSSYYSWTNWAGRFDSQWSLATAVAENPKVMASNRLAIAHMIWNKYRAEYNAVFPVPLPIDLDPTSPNAGRFPAAGKPKANATDPDGPWELMAANDRVIINTILANYAKAIAAYERRLVSGNSSLDRFIAGDNAALSPEARRGLKIFLGKGNCVGCHSGPLLTDNKFHAIGVAQTGVGVPASDLGRFTDVVPLLASPFNSNGIYSDNQSTGKLTGVAQDPAQRGQFRTPGLRNVSKSGVYMHSGQLATLEAVVAFYVAGGTDVSAAGITKEIAPLTFGGTDSADLVAFLKSLDGAPVPPALLVDTSKP